MIPHNRGTQLCSVLHSGRCLVRKLGALAEFCHLPPPPGVVADDFLIGTGNLAFWQIFAKMPMEICGVNSTSAKICQFANLPMCQGRTDPLSLLTTTLDATRLRARVWLAIWVFLQFEL